MKFAENTIENYFTETEKNFQDKGLNTNKRLRKYDCWEENVKPN
jgi:hypothetical protein